VNNLHNNEEKGMTRKLGTLLGTCTLLLAACAAAPPSKPSGWNAPEVVVAPSSFAGVHGLAIDKRGRLLAGSVVGNSIWEVDRNTGAAKILVGGPEGQADDIAIGPNGEMAWTNYLMGMLRYRENDNLPMRVLAKDLPGLNSLDFDRKSGKLYASQVFLGDALWEIDVSGAKPPRLIAKDLGGLNGFEVGPDGMIYGPLWFKNSVVKVDPANGAVTVINKEFKIPAAANLDGKGNLWVVDAATGELNKVELASGRKTVVKTLKTSLDNLAISPEGTVYVSNMADNSIESIDPATGAVKVLTRGALAVPSGVKVSGGTLWVADVFSYRKVDLASGAVSDVMRMHGEGVVMEYPFAVGLSDKLVALASWFTGTVQVLDRATNKTLAMTHGWKAPYDALPLADGSLLVAEIATGNITQASGADFGTRKVVASGLAGPVQMTLGRDGALYVTEAAGNLQKINLADGTKSMVASGLALPEGVAQTPWGTFIVAEAGTTRLVEIDPATKLLRTVAEKLPIGLSGGPGMPPPYVATGVDVGADGTIYFSANRNNAIYRVRPMR
jgi:DNA-binding beta-propeller fold protein YncE